MSVSPHGSKAERIGTLLELAAECFGLLHDRINRAGHLLVNLFRRFVHRFGGASLQCGHFDSLLSARGLGLTRFCWNRPHGMQSPSLSRLSKAEFWADFAG